MSDDRTEAANVIREFAACWNRHDMQAFAFLFAPNAEFVNVVGLWWKGRAEIQKAHEFAHATFFSQSRLTIENTEVRSVADDIVIARSRWTLVGHTTDDAKALPARSGILVNVLARSNAGWSIIDSQNTDIVEHQLSRPR